MNMLNLVWNKIQNICRLQCRIKDKKATTSDVSFPVRCNLYTTPYWNMKNLTLKIVSNIRPLSVCICICKRRTQLTNMKSSYLLGRTSNPQSITSPQVHLLSIRKSTYKRAQTACNGIILTYPSSNKYVAFLSKIEQTGKGSALEKIFISFINIKSHREKSLRYKMPPSSIPIRATKGKKGKKIKK